MELRVDTPSQLTLREFLFTNDPAFPFRNLFEHLDLHTYPPLDRGQARPKT